MNIKDYDELTEEQERNRIRLAAHLGRVLTEEDASEGGA